MGRLILVYKINDYEAMGGGIKVEYPNDLEEMDKLASDLLKDERVTIMDAVGVGEDYIYKAVEKVVKYERETK